MLASTIAHIDVSFIAAALKASIKVGTDLIAVVHSESAFIDIDTSFAIVSQFVSFITTAFV
jgi:hypothetical protein